MRKNEKTILLWLALLFVEGSIISGCGLNNPFRAPEPPKPKKVELIYPRNGDTLGPGKINFAWVIVERRELYHLQVSSSPNFDSCVVDTMTVARSYLYSNPDTIQYFWRVKVQTLTYHEWSDWSDEWSVWVKKINHPPDASHNPTPDDGVTSVTVTPTLEWVSGDRDGDTVIYFLYFGKDSAFSPVDTIVDATGIYPAYISYKLDTLEYNTKYYWKVDAKDNWGAYSYGPIWEFSTGTPDGRPDVPSIPTGPALEYIDLPCSFTTQTSDPDGDSVRYKFSFGDGHQSDWTPFVPSGQSGSIQHTYTKVGTFYVKAKAQDVHYEESEWSDSANIIIKVGPGACWVADVDGNKVVKLGVGGSKVCQFDDQGEPPWHHEAFKEPLTLRVDKEDGCCWVACTIWQGIFKLAPNCSLLVSYVAPEGVYENPSTPCIDKNHNCWVSLAWIKELTKFERYTMAKLASITDNLGPNTYPIAIELDVDSNWLWVVERDYFTAGYVSKFNALTHDRIFKRWGFKGSWAEVDPVTHYCWVADDENCLVRKISPNGDEVTSFGGFNTPSCVSIDPITHNVWIADKGNHQVVKLSESGDEIFRLSEVNNLEFNYPVAVEVDPNDGSCWIADPGNSRVVKVSANGSFLVEVRDFVTPMGLCVNPEVEP